MCCKDRQDYAIKVPASAWSGSGPYVASITLGTGDYVVPFAWDAAWLSAVNAPDADEVTVRRRTSSGALVGGTLPAVISDLRIPFSGVGVDLFLTVSGDALASAPDLFLVFSAPSSSC